MMRKRISKDLIERAKRCDVVTLCRIADRLMSREKRGGYRAALPFLRKAAVLHDRWAEYHLGLIYDHGLSGVSDKRKAIQWYTRSASGGFDSAQLNLGIVLANLSGKRRSLQQAIRLYRLAARKGNTKAAYNLELYYHEGRGINRSPRLAELWYQKAATAGDRQARRILAEMRKGRRTSVVADRDSRDRPQGVRRRGTR